MKNYINYNTFLFKNKFIEPKYSNINFYFKNFIKNYSTVIAGNSASVKLKNSSLFPDFKSLYFFNDCESAKLKILNTSKGKIGIYLWINKVNGKKYVGSSINLKRRFLEYYNINRLTRGKSMAINRSLLRYGFSKFSLHILEFCDIKNLMIREKYYINKIRPEYNILKDPGSPSRGKG